MDIAQEYPEFAKWMWSDKVLAQMDFKVLAESGKYPLATDLLQSVGVAVALTFVHILLRYVLFNPLFKIFLGIRDVTLEKNPAYEKLYRAYKPRLPDPNDVKKMSESSGETVTTINSWLKTRQSNDRNSIKLKRFVESFWRFSLYVIAFGLDVIVVLGQPWSENTVGCWRDLWTHEADSTMKTFYILVQLPLYIHLLAFQLLDLHKSGSWEMTLHHVLVITLMVFAYLGNFLRIGCLALVYHDVTDLFIELSKMLRYLRWYTLSDILFAMFGVSWGIARIYLFLSVVVRSIVIESIEEDVGGKSFYFFASLIAVLILLNFHWFYVISRVAYRILWSGVDSSSKTGGTDLSTDDDSDSSYFSEMSDAGQVKLHED